MGKSIFRIKKKGAKKGAGYIYSTGSLFIAGIPRFPSPSLIDSARSICRLNFEEPVGSTLLTV